MRAAGIPLWSDEILSETIAETERRRRLLKAFIGGERREWPVIGR